MMNRGLTPEEFARERRLARRWLELREACNQRVVQADFWYARTFAMKRNRWPEQRLRFFKQFSDNANTRFRLIQSAIGNILNNARSLHYGELTLSSCNI